MRCRCCRVAGTEGACSADADDVQPGRRATRGEFDGGSGGLAEESRSEGGGAGHDHDGGGGVQWNFGASGGWPDEAEEAAIGAAEFDEGSFENGVGWAEGAGLEGSEGGEGFGGFGDAEGLSAGEVGSFEAAGIVFILGAAVRVGGGGGRGACGVGACEEGLAQVIDDELDDDCLVHGGRG